MEGLEEGLEKGEKKKALDIARKLKSKGMFAADISDLTGLPIDEINEL